MKFRIVFVMGVAVGWSAKYGGSKYTRVWLADADIVLTILWHLCSPPDAAQSFNGLGNPFRTIIPAIYTRIAPITGVRI